jgi:hypothetical protein
MAFEMREMSGSLFRNERKGKDTHADHQGTCLIGGVEYYVNAWIKESKDGQKKFFSLSFKPKGETGQQGISKAREATQKPLIDDLPPF